VACAQTLLESVSEIAGTTADAAGTSPTGSEDERDLGTIAGAMRRRWNCWQGSGRRSIRSGRWSGCFWETDAPKLPAGHTDNECALGEFRLELLWRLPPKPKKLGAPTATSVALDAPYAATRKIPLQPQPADVSGSEIGPLSETIASC
jgi:hypothetical protein